MKTTKINTTYLIEEGVNRAMIYIHHQKNDFSIWRICIKTKEFKEVCERFARNKLKESKSPIPNFTKNERFKLDKNID